MRELAFDAAFLAGVGCVVYGVWTIYHPAGFIVGGALLAVGSYFAGRTDTAVDQGQEGQIELTQQNQIRP